MALQEVLSRLQRLANPRNVAGMARFGIRTKQALGIASPQLKKLAKELGKNHTLAQELWESGFLEARMLAGLIDDPKAVTEEQMEKWVLDFDNWAICDSITGYLFDKTPYANAKILAWAERPEEYVKRASFAMIAWTAVHDKKAPNDKFEAYMPLIEAAAMDERNYVKKAVNWALRQIGKRNRELNQLAINTALKLQQLNSKSARWIANDALRELKSAKVKQRLK